MNLISKTIVITGGTSGIGYQMVKQLNKDNTVIVLARNQNKLNKISNEFPNITSYKVDLSDIQETEAIADILLKSYESIDVLVNNAAIQNTPSFLHENFNYQNISREITLNLTSICSLCYLLLPLLLKDSRSIILNINSGLALTPKTTSAVYCATKGGLNIFTQSLRYQLAASNICVQQVFLDLVDTAMTLGRGKNKMSAETAASKIIAGMQRNILENDLGKVKLLRFLLRLAPSIAKNIIRKL